MQVDAQRIPGGRIIGIFHRRQLLLHVIVFKVQMTVQEGLGDLFILIVMIGDFAVPDR